ncbi:hypothetical protein Plhal304r1_c028g0093851 [Plasmopara halstedii]
MLMWSRLEKKWNDIQVGRQGSYSVERLESFNAYCEATSYTHVILVCLLAPIPTVTIAILLESLPLRHPSEGWRANWMFWIRQTIAAFMTTFVGTLSFATFVPVLAVSPIKSLIIPFSLAVMYVTTMVLASSKIGFPIPFIQQISSTVIATYIPVVLVLAFGKSVFTKKSNCRPYLLRFQRNQYAYFALITTYPLCKALYDFTHPKYRNYTVIALLIWKFGAKYLMISASRELEDLIPQTLAFTVDLYSSLFMSVCMSSAGSLLLSALLIAADLGLTLLEFRELRANAFVVVQLLNEKRLSQGSLQSAILSESPDLLAMILEVTRDPCASNIVSMRGVRLHACLPHPLTDDLSKQLQLLAASGLYSQDVTNNTHSARQHNLKSRFLIKTSIQPIGPNFVNVSTKQQTQKEVNRSGVFDSKFRNGKRSEKLLLQGLQFLFHCEYLALVEYTECVVPTIYVMYKSVLELLPNIVYYPGGAGHWGSFAISNIMLFAMLEMGSFLFLNQFIQRKFKISPVYQVAYVLESQVWKVQSILFLAVFLLPFELAHHGVDFTFRFDWIH